MGIVENIIKKVLEKGTIEEKVQISESVYKIKIKSEDISNLEFAAGHFLRLGVGIGKDEISFKDKVRSYSIWDIDKKNKTIDLAIATDSKGIGAKWVENCTTDQTVYFKLKKGNFVVDDAADSYLMIGDLSAISHLYIIKRNLSADKQVESIIYSQTLNDLFADIDGNKPFNFYELKQNPYDEIINKIQGLIPKMQGRKMVYIAGDSRICVALNKYFKNELNWNTKQIKTKPFWNPEKKGLE